MGMRGDLGVGETVHFPAEYLEGLVEAAGAENQGAVGLLDQSGEVGAGLAGITGCQQRLDRRHPGRGEIVRVEAEIGRPHRLSLVHRNAAEDLRDILSGADAGDEILHLAELAARRQAVRIGGQLADRLDIGCEPAEAVNRALFEFQPFRRDAPVHLDHLANVCPRPGQKPVKREGCLRKKRGQFACGSVRVDHRGGIHGRLR